MTNHPIILGYKIIESLDDNFNSTVYRAVRIKDNYPVILKILKPKYPTPQQLNRYRREYEITSLINSENVIKAYDLEAYENTLIMILEDFEGKNLSKICQNKPLPLTEFLTIAIAICQGLHHIHQAQIIHKDLNPSNILYNAQTQQLKIIDFGLATSLTQENTNLQNPHLLEGTLAYISPEQTGRMNRLLDYRTDFYSLGVTFYQLLTGKLPFRSEEALKLIHYHLAKNPLPLNQIIENNQTTIPEIIEKIIFKLMAKTAEDRYQSAWGLKCDLENCLNQLQTHQKITYFSLGNQDLYDQFHIPQKLYGRDREIKQLLETFARIITPQNHSKLHKNELIFVTGYSGMGKSALVREIYKPITANQGYFITGKFEQLKRNIPYSGIIEAFSQLIQQILTESEIKLQQWQEKILNALAGNGQIMIDVIPEIALIIGQQTSTINLPPAEAKNRFKIVFQNFIQVFTQSSQPLVIFLDDLQWADQASLKLLELLILNSEGKLLIIGAYRDHEVNATHPLQLTLNKLQKQIKINQINLQPLDIQAINQLIADTLKSSVTETLTLAELVIKKTRGNPFFVNNFLTNLFEEKLIYFIYPQSSQPTGTWQWNLAEIKAQNITENLVEFLSNKIKKLPIETQEILEIASCIGHKFNIEIIKLITKQPLKNIVNLLKNLIQDGFIFRLNNHEQTLELNQLQENIFISNNSPSYSKILENQYQFAHDRIQQAVYSLISTSKKAEIHDQISQILLNNLSKQQQEEAIFTLVNQLNQSLILIKSLTEKKQLAQLNLIAGKKAKLSAAYQSALDYLQIGLLQLDQKYWQLSLSSQEDYQLILSLYIETAETAYLCGDFSLMEHLVKTITKKAHSLLDKIQAYQIKIQAYIAQNKLRESILLGIETLKKLKINLPKNPSKLTVLIAVINNYLRLNSKNIESLINLPMMTDSEQIYAMEILTTLNSSAYLALPNLAPIIVFKQVNLSVKYGNNNLSAYAYATYGVILCFFLGKCAEGFKFGQLALQLLEKYQSEKIKAKTILVFNDLIRHWQEHLNTTLQPLLEGYTIGLETGDLEFACLCANAYCYHSYFVGKSLLELEKEVNAYKLKASQLKQNTSFCLLNIWHQSIIKLSDLSTTSLEIVCCHPAKDQTILFVINFNQLFLNYIFGNYDQAIKYANLTAQYLDGGIGVFTVPLYYYYDSLSRLAHFDLVNSTTQKQYLKQVKAQQKKIKKWADHVPCNHRHRFYLICAEICRVLHQDLEAMTYYDQAIFYAKENQYLQDEALANEKAGEFYLAQNKPQFAQIYFWEAYYHYLTWGAIHKAESIKVKYPQFIDYYAQRLQQINKDFTINTSSYNMDISLDLESVMKANQAISRSLILDESLTNLMQILIENVGAELGYLILESKDKLLIEAESSLHHHQVIMRQSLPIEHSNKVPETLIYYVARIQKQVIIQDATKDEHFAQDPYIMRNQPKSILCVPLVNQNKLIGIVYLENNLTVGAFTPNRIKMVNLLSAQAAISIENSRLYDNLNALNVAYERFIPRQFINLLQKDSITEIELGHNIEQKMSVLFCDIRSFTTLSEQMTPADNFKFINAYLSRISPAIREYQGFIDKYIGDAIMALFTGKADNALKAAIKMLSILADYNMTRQRPERPPIKIGIGINTGNLMLGTVGEENRMDSTVISDAVNLASRIEGLTKNYGVELLITQQTLNDLENNQDYAIRFIDQVRVKGKSELITVYEVFNGDEQEIKQQKLDTKNLFEEALIYYHQGQILEAQNQLLICEQECPQDSVVKIYLQRCQDLLI